MDAKTWAIGQRRLEVLGPLVRSERRTAGAVDAAARELGIERAQCYRLLRRLRAEPTVTALLPRPGGRPVGLRLLGAAVETVIAAAINDFYLDRRCPAVSDLVREIERRCVADGLMPPSRRAVALRLRSIDRREALRRRKGARVARHKLGRIVGHLAEDRPLGLVQIDHTLADIIVVSASDRRPLKRPWLTLAIDVATRMVAGFHLSLDEPSALSVALALSHAVLPKDDYLRGRGLDVSWPVAGLPRCLHLDNAKEFRSEALRRGVAQYGIELRHRPPAAPHWGGHIERLIGTTMGALRVLPGATGRNVADRPGDPEATAAMTLDELESWLVHQIAGVYHNSVHRGLGMAPATAWIEATARLQVPHRHPPDADRFFLDFLPFKRRTIQRDGASRGGCAATGDPWSPGVAARPSPTHDPATVLHREMAGLQGAMLAEAARGQSQELHPQARRAAIAEDLVWAFTRPDRTYADRLAYEALASELLDSPWRMARRRRPGPVDFVALGLDERHIMLATATVLTGPPRLRRLFYRPTGGWEEDLALLNRRLRDPDHAEFRDRWRRWRDPA